MDIQVREIKTKKELWKFIRFPQRLYSGNDYYTPPILSSELKTLSSDKNPAFEFCDCKLWLAYKEGKIVGRIAGIINNNYNEQHKIRNARFGWLDFIEDEDILNSLLIAAENWARENNMEYIHGPLGFTSFDASGILIEGFKEIPASFAHYNYQYYSELIEKNGYIKDIDWIEFKIKVPQKVPDKIRRGARIIKQKYNLHAVKEKTTRGLKRYVKDLFNIINITYKDFYGFSELTAKQSKLLEKDFLSLLNPEFVSLVVDQHDKLIAFGISLPSLSKAVKKSKGRLFPFGYFRIYRALHKNDKVDLLLIAIDPNYQNKGINAIIFDDLMQVFIDKKIVDVETTRELEDNIKVQQLWKDYESMQHKRVRCYIKKL